MTYQERIKAANDKFESKWGWSSDEWTEFFSAGVTFAEGLIDCKVSEEMKESVVKWLEESADLPLHPDDQPRKKRECVACNGTGEVDDC